MSSARATGLFPVDATQPIVLVIAGRVTAADIPRLSEELRQLLHASDAQEVDCDVGAVAGPDLHTVEVLARLRLAARRRGCRIRLRHPPPQLCALLHLVGLGEIF
ncbi:STAS domain-containing protein [Streptomyces sp. 21So2-11]|uniref:STAS domain-containing protein n=1 Tax=Streptomyces sp. 21So2-11 TaxID=3144408 RepID=UPI00321910D9